MNKSGNYNPSNDANQHKKHCYVACLNNKCNAGLDVANMPGQLLKEVTDAIKDYGWNPTNWDWQEMINDTLATIEGHIKGWKLFFGDCAKDCDCPRLGS